MAREQYLRGVDLEELQKPFFAQVSPSLQSKPFRKRAKFLERIRIKRAASFHTYLRPKGKPRDSTARDQILQGRDAPVDAFASYGTCQNIAKKTQLAPLIIIIEKTKKSILFCLFFIFFKTI